jgi:hypothetical protein
MPEKSDRTEDFPADCIPTTTHDGTPRAKSFASSRISWTLSMVLKYFFACSDAASPFLVLI